ncbi:MAG: asparagine synthase-related protein, partial [Bacteroidales bacterium]
GFGQVAFYPDHSKIGIYNNELLILSDCRLDNRIELIEKLEINNDSISDDELIIHAFEKWKYECTKYLIGDFAFVIWNIETKELFCARDHFGVKPFYYFFNEETLVFSSEISAIFSQTDLNFSVDQQYIADALSIVKSENNRTTYSEIKKLPPAHYLNLKNNQLEVREYWKLSIQKELKIDEQQIIEQFKKLLIEAVECRVTQDAKTGAELSGGLDSSTVVAIASQFCKVKTFSHIMPDGLLGKIHPFTDEREFIQLLNDYCGIQDMFFITSENKGLLDTLYQNIQDFKHIGQQNFSTFSDHLYTKAQQEGVSVLLSGFGGDEVVSSKSESYQNELAQSELWDELKLDLQDQKLNQIHVFIKLTRYFLKTKCPRIYNSIALIKSGRDLWKGKFDNLALNNEFSERMKIKERYFLQFRKNKNGTLQEKNIERICHPHVSQRLEYCSSATRKFGIEYRYPLLDKRLIEFYLSMPIRLKARNGIKRYAIRKAIEEFVPEEIFKRNDKSGTTIPTVFMRMLNDKDKIAEIISRSKLNPIITSYIDLGAYEKWYIKLCQRSQQKQTNINPGAFYNYLKLIIFIEQNPSLFK